MPNINNMTDTWNTGSTTYKAVRMDVTKTGAASGSKLVEMLVNSDEQFSVSQYGELRTAGGWLSSASRTALTQYVAALQADGSAPVANSLFYDGTLFYRGSTGATAISDLPGLLPPEEVDARHFGAVNDNTTDNASAINAAIDYLGGIGGGVLHIRGGGIYYYNSTIYQAGNGSAYSNIHICVAPDTRLRQGANALPGIYNRGGTNCRIYGGGHLEGCHDELPDYDDLFTTGGLSDGSGDDDDDEETIAVSAAGTAGDTFLALTGLPDGWIMIGHRIEVNENEYAYVSQTNVEVVSGAATVQLDRGLEADVANGATVGVKFSRRRLIVQEAASVGATSLVIGCYSVTSGTTARMLVGDEFFLHTNNNDPSSLDTGNILKSATQVNFSGTSPSVTVTVTLASPLQVAVAKGTMTTSIQDNRNNRFAMYLAVATTDNAIEGMVVSDCVMHGLSHDSCVRAPWDGLTPEARTNYNPRVENCRDENNVRGTAIGGTGNVNMTIRGNRGQDQPNRRHIQQEGLVNGTFEGNYAKNMQRAIQLTGNSTVSTVYGNHTENCQIGHSLRTQNRELIYSNNTVIMGASSNIGCVIRAGWNLDLSDEPERRNLTVVANNRFKGPDGVVGGTYNGTLLFIRPNRTSTDVNENKGPHDIIVTGNTYYRPPRAGIIILRGTDITLRDETIIRPGYNGVWLDSCIRPNLFNVKVEDAGATVANAAFLFNDCEDVVIDHLYAKEENATSQTYGIEITGTCTFRHIGHMELEGATGSTNNDAFFANSFYGFNSGESMGTSAQYNVLHGRGSGKNIVAGGRNTAMGDNSLEAVTSGDRNTAFGARTNVASGGISHGLALGYGAVIQADQTLSLGPSDGTNPLSTATAASGAGVGTALPATPEGYLRVYLNGTWVALPYYPVAAP